MRGKFKEQGKHSRILKLNKNLLPMSAPQCGQKHNALHLQPALWTALRAYTVVPDTMQTWQAHRSLHVPDMVHFCVLLCAQSWQFGLRSSRDTMLGSILESNHILDKVRRAFSSKRPFSPWLCSPDFFQHTIFKGFLLLCFTSKGSTKCIWLWITCISSCHFKLEIWSLSALFNC